MTEHKRHKAAQLRRNDAGVTLIEIIFAAGIMATTLGIMLGSLVTLAVMGDVAEGRTRATIAMASVMEEARGMGTNLLELEPAPVTVDGHVMLVTMEVLDANGNYHELPLQSVSATLSDPMEVRVTVEWQDRRGRVYPTIGAMIR